MAPERRPHGSGPVALGPGREFDAIRRFTAGLTLPEGVVVGPGDDCTVLDDGWVVSVDSSVEDVHFRRGWLSDEEVGYRAVGAALSDLAAMAAAPVAVLLSVAARSDAVDLDALQAGARRMAESCGTAVVGGDLTQSPGPLFVDVTVVGRVSRAVLRSGAQPGDEVWVTGTLGGPAAAVRLLEEGAPLPADLRSAFTAPPCRIREARALVEEEPPSALIDLSDGLAGDAAHLSAASGVRIILETDAVPVHPSAGRAMGASDALRLALHGGEDYELCFTAHPGRVHPGRFRDLFDVPLTRVGRVEEGEGVWLEDAHGSVVPAPAGGYDHLAREEEA